jgi:hypothetical protein
LCGPRLFSAARFFIPTKRGRIGVIAGTEYNAGNMSDVQQTIGRIFDGYLNNLAQFDETVDLLESYHSNLPPTERARFFEVLWQRFSSAPLSHLGGKRTPHEIVIRACARFGPVDALPAHLFAALNWKNPAQMESWAVKLGSEFVHSLFSYKDRFSKAALEQIKAQVALIISDNSPALLGVAFPQQLQDIATRLSTAVDKINFEGFQKTIVGSRSGRDSASSEKRRHSDRLKLTNTPGGRSLAIFRRAGRLMSF